MASLNNNMGHIIMNICTVHTMWLCLCEYDCPWALSVQSQLCCTGLQQHPVFLQQNAVVFFLFFLLQFWKSSHRCCIDTPVEGPGEESGEPAAWTHYLSLIAPHPSNHPPLCLLSPRTTLHLPWLSFF